MYAIYLKSSQDMNNVFHAIRVMQPFTRFTFEIEREQRKTMGLVIFRNVRLKVAKPYCGNHAGPCKINPLFHKPHKKGKWLEGADWVAFNDFINDMLDEMGIETIRVQSSTCLIRRGLKRCIEYFENDKGNGDFDRFGTYANCIGIPTKAAYPNGTPGIDEWRKQYD